MVTGLSSPRSLICGVFEADSQRTSQTFSFCRWFFPSVPTDKLYDLTVLLALQGIILTGAKEHLNCQTRLESLDLSQPTWEGKKEKRLINDICLVFSSLKGLEGSLCLRLQLLETMSQLLLCGFGLKVRIILVYFNYLWLSDISQWSNHGDLYS